MTTSSRMLTGLQIDADRLWASLMDHAQIGGLPNGGVCRETLTETDKQGRDLFAHWCAQADLDMRIDELGNMFATRSGEDSTLEPVAMGSHLDTQPTGGKFDGILGVLAGLEVIRTLNDADIKTRRPITIVNWTNEEGSRFTPSMLGSGAYAGVFNTNDMLVQKDLDGVSCAEALAKIGYAGCEPVGAFKFYRHIELHIEQGPVLEDAGMEIGVVTGSQAMSWNEVTISGRPAHAGTTPMPNRLDPLQATLRVLTKIFDHANATLKACATVGAIRTRPESHSTIPKSVTFLLDLRHPDPAQLACMISLFEEAANIERTLGFEIARKEFGTSPQQSFARDAVDAIRQAAKDLGLTHCDIISGAGHDAIYINAVCPSGMIFVPCDRGISHNPAEAITPAQAAAGANVLLHTVLKLAG